MVIHGLVASGHDVSKKHASKKLQLKLKMLVVLKRSASRNISSTL
jgi:hypothetical protein